MNLPKAFISNCFFELGRTVITRAMKKRIEIYHKRLTWWLDIYGVRFKHHGYYIMIKKNCF